MAGALAGAPAWLAAMLPGGGGMSPAQQALAALGTALLAYLSWTLLRLARADADLRLLAAGAAPAGAFRGRVIWVVGASQGIGELLATALAARGAKLILSSRRQEALEGVAEACRAAAAAAAQPAPCAAAVLPCDLKRPSELPAVAARAASLAGPGGIDAIYLVAGATQRALVEDTDSAVDRDLFEINVLGPIALAKAALPAMLSRGGGQFVVISSMAGKVASPVQATYAATKHALHGYFDSLRSELGARGISVTLACPGPTATALDKRTVYGATLAQSRVAGAAAPAASGGPSAADGDRDGSARMAPGRCAELILAAAAHRLPEAWIAKHPVLLFGYISQYLPGLAARLSVKVGAKRAAAYKAGGSLYAGIASSVLGGGRK